MDLVEETMGAVCGVIPDAPRRQCGRTLNPSTLNLNPSTLNFGLGL